MEKWQIFLNKKIKLVYEDGLNHYSVKYGILKEVNNTHLILESNSCIEGINLNKILRIEENKNA